MELLIVATVFNDLDRCAKKAHVFMYTFIIIINVYRLQKQLKFPGSVLFFINWCRKLFSH